MFSHAYRYNGLRRISYAGLTVLPCTLLAKLYAGHENWPALFHSFAFLTNLVSWFYFFIWFRLPGSRTLWLALQYFSVLYSVIACAGWCLFLRSGDWPDAALHCLSPLLLLLHWRYETVHTGPWPSWVLGLALLHLYATMLPLASAQLLYAPIAVNLEPALGLLFFGYFTVYYSHQVWFYTRWDREE